MYLTQRAFNQLPDGESWFTVRNLSIRIATVDEKGVNVHIYPAGREDEASLGSGGS